MSAGKETVTSPVKAGPEGDPATVPAHPRLALFAVLLASFMTFFEVSVVYVAVPDIQRDLGTSYGAVQWVLAGYTLPFALLLVTGGRLGDIAGHRRVFLGGVAAFVVTSTAAALAGSIELLVAARVLQGVAAAIMGPQVLALFRVMVPARRREPALALYAVVAGLATVCGPILGGVLVQSDLFGWGWRTIFLVNLPVGLLASAIALFAVPASRPSGHTRLDLAGVLLAAGALLLLLHPLMYGRELGWPWWCWVSVAASVPALAAFLGLERGRERRGRTTLIPLALFRNQVFAAGLLINFLVAALLTGFFLVFAVFLQSGLDLSPMRTGTTMTPWAFGTAAASLVAIRLTRRFGRYALLGAVASMVAGMAVLLLVIGAGSGVRLDQGATAAGLVAFGAGIGVVSTSILNMTVAALPPAEAGSAAGVFTTVRQVGSAFGVAAGGALFFGLVGTPELASQARHLDAMRLTLLFDLALCALIVLLLFRLPRTATKEA
ncbi:MFS transporter [Amycolatopsis aidingensis]|uniref:MFS transporter n=1 Tax=Amycolatopsis aidingensis TaxID=2842453 RepID=UPI001C0D3716|nr:MFS transporter [Amycolatopsis aidingensis]